MYTRRHRTITRKYPTKFISKEEDTAIDVALGAAPLPSNLSKLNTIGKSIDAREMGVIAGLLFRNFITGETVNALPISYEELRRITEIDGEARGLLRLLTMPIDNAKWDLLSAEEDLQVAGGHPQKEVVGSTTSKERDFIQQNLFAVASDGGMTTPFNDIIAVLALAIRDGFKCFEKVFAINPQGRVMLQKLGYRDNGTVTLLADDTGDFNGIRQRCHFNGKYIDIVIPKEKSLLYSFGKEEYPLYGMPVFLPVYYHMDKKHKLYYISHVAYQNLAIPPRVGKVPSGATPDVKKKFLSDLAALGFNAAMTIPLDFEVEAFESKRSLADFMPLIDHHNTMAAKAVMGQFMDLTRSSTGRLAGEQQDVFVMSIVSVLRDIETIFNNWVIPQLVDFNFGSKAYPKLRSRAFTDADQEAISTTFKEVMTAGVSHSSPEFMIALEKKMAGQLDIKSLDYEQIAKDQKQRLIDAQAQQAQMAAGNSEGQAKSKGNKGGKSKVPNEGNA